MVEPVNLRLARKQKARADKQDKAAQNRAVFGRDKTDKARQTLEREQARKHLDGVKREREPGA